MGMLFCIIIMSRAMFYEGRNPSKQRKRDRLAPLYLPTNPYAPPKGGPKLTLSRVPCVFMRKAKQGISKSILPFKDKKKKTHLENITKIFTRLLVFWTKIWKENTSLLSSFILSVFEVSPPVFIWVADFMHKSLNPCSPFWWGCPNRHCVSFNK